jgi:hypothetical protein
MVFLHVPKTGGVWAVEAMKAAGIEFEPIGVYGHHARYDVDIGDRFAFGFVREPLSWHGSIWNFRRKEGFSGYLDPWISLDFPDFLGQVIEHQPGHLSMYYTSFVGPPDDEIDFIGRYENLVDDLVEGLRLAGEDFDEQALRALPPLNVSSSQPHCPPELRERMIRAELDAYRRFYPEELGEVNGSP